MLTYLKNITELGKNIVGVFYPTASNGKFSGIYQQNGFDEKNMWIKNCSEFIPYPSWISVQISDNIGDPSVVVPIGIPTGIPTTEEEILYRELLQWVGVPVSKNIDNFHEITDFGSLTMMYILGKIKTFNKNYKANPRLFIKNYLESPTDLVDIRTFCRRCIA